MSATTHGFSIGTVRTGEAVFLSLTATGKLTHEDYEEMMPTLESALDSVKQPSVRVLLDVTRFEGWEPRAAWDDFRIGLKHGNKFEKIALYGNRQWQENIARIASWFTSGEVIYFENEEAALLWLAK